MSADEQVQAEQAPENVRQLNGALLTTKATSIPRSIFTMNQEHLERLKLLAKMISQSQLAYAKNGRASLSEGDAFLVMLKGIELGFEPMAALDMIDIIQGQTALKPVGMLALMYQSQKFEYIRIEGDDTQCTVIGKRKDLLEPMSVSFTMKDADTFQTTEWVNNEKKTIPLSQKYNWKSQPGLMLQWRAVGKFGRTVCPDITHRMYTPEELMPDAIFNESGEIIEIPQQNVSGSTRNPNPNTEQPASAGGEKKSEQSTPAETKKSERVETPAESIVRQIRSRIAGITDAEIREFGDVKDMLNKDQWKASFPDAKTSAEVVEQFVEVYNLSNGVVPEDTADAATDEHEHSNPAWNDVDLHMVVELATDVYCLGDEAQVLADLGKAAWSDFTTPDAAKNALRNKAIQEKSRIVLAKHLRYKKLNAKSNYVEMYADDLTFRIYSRQMLRDLGIEGWGEGESPDNWEPHPSKKRFLPKGYELEIPEGKWEPAKSGDHFEIKELKIAF